MPLSRSCAATALVASAVPTIWRMGFCAGSPKIRETIQDPGDPKPGTGEQNEQEDRSRRDRRERRRHGRGAAHTVFRVIHHPAVAVGRVGWQQVLVALRVVVEGDGLRGLVAQHGVGVISRNVDVNDAVSSVRQHLRHTAPSV